MKYKIALLSAITLATHIPFLAPMQQNQSLSPKEKVFHSGLTYSSILSFLKPQEQVKINEVSTGLLHNATISSRSERGNIIQHRTPIRLESFSKKPAVLSEILNCWNINGSPQGKTLHRALSDNTTLTYKLSPWPARMLEGQETLVIDLPSNIIKGTPAKKNLSKFFDDFKEEELSEILDLLEGEDRLEILNHIEKKSPLTGLDNIEKLRYCNTASTQFQATYDQLSNNLPQKNTLEYFQYERMKDMITQNAHVRSQYTTDFIKFAQLIKTIQKGLLPLKALRYLVIKIPTLNSPPTSTEGSKNPIWHYCKLLKLLISSLQLNAHIEKVIVIYKYSLGNPFEQHLPYKNLLYENILAHKHLKSVHTLGSSADIDITEKDCISYLPTLKVHVHKNCSAINLSTTFFVSGLAIDRVKDGSVIFTHAKSRTAYVSEFPDDPWMLMRHSTTSCTISSDNDNANPFNKNRSIGAIIDNHADQWQNNYRQGQGTNFRPETMTMQEFASRMEGKNNPTFSFFTPFE